MLQTAGQIIKILFMNKACCAAVCCMLGPKFRNDRLRFPVAKPRHLSNSENQILRISIKQNPSLQYLYRHIR
jgi:hypothetical protein